MVSDKYFRGGDLLYLTSRVSFCLYYYCASQVMYVSIMSLVCKSCDLCCNAVSDCGLFMQRCNIRRPHVCTWNVA